MQPLQINGKTDDGDLIDVVNELVNEHGIPRNRIRRDWFITIHRDTGKADKITAFLSKEETKNRIVHNPDIIVLDYEEKKILLIIELDGSIHDTPSGQKKTRKRNEAYNDAGLQYCVLNKAEMKELGLMWQGIVGAHIRPILKSNNG